VRRLVVSDIHANFEALDAVLWDASGLYDEIICAGDLVGYGASPAEVLDWARGADGPRAIVRGNHDRAAAVPSEAEDFNEYALEALLWTRAQLRRDDLDWLGSLPAGPLERECFTIAHGSPAGEDDYLVSGVDIESVRARLTRPMCVVGHSHIQGGWSLERGGVVRLARPTDSERERVIDLQAGFSYVINPGSVGQPRDRDPRAAYAIWDQDEALLRFRRARYNVRAAQERIRDAGLPAFLADRLAAGK
jgi:diadenosine tetraphosphatase ApaH/serine/threonine PP2A family protein phosphatase